MTILGDAEQSRRIKASPLASPKPAASGALFLCVVAAFISVSLLSQPSAGSDNDSLLRLVQVRDLLAGQGWFDPHQYRMGPAGGFAMHWSRLVDAPIAVLLMLAGERVTLFLYPVLLFAAALFLLLRIARHYAGLETEVPAAIIGGAALYYTGVFAPGMLDHHNIQLVLTLGAFWALIAANTTLRRALCAGTAAALSLAIGMETAPYVAAAGIIAAGLFAFDANGRGKNTAQGFGLGFGLVPALVFVATINPERWFVPACDAFSVVQLVVTAAAGLGLAILASLPFTGRSFVARCIGLLVLGIVLAVIVIAAFPQCLADPYASLDPRLRMYWLDSIEEAQPLMAILRSDPAMAAAYYITPVIGLLLLAQTLWQQPQNIKAWIAFGFLFTAFMVAAWQIRGAVFAIPFAAIPLSALVTRMRANSDRSVAATLKMVGAWIISINLVWSVAAGWLSPATARGAPAEKNASDCTAQADLAALAALPATRVFASSNLGAPILAYSSHSVVAGPYHRNTDGNLQALDIQMGPLDEARALLQQNGFTILAFCPGNPESGALAGWAPKGLSAALLTGKPPAWLEPIAQTDNANLRLFRIR